MSHDDQPGTHSSIREIAREVKAVHSIVHKDIRLKCLKKKRAQQLTEVNMLTRLVRSKHLFREYPQSMVHFGCSTKQCTEQSPVLTIGAKKKQVPAARLLRTRSTFSKYVTVSVGVSSLGATELIFVEPGVKINGAYYRDVLLSQNLLPAIRSQSGDFFIFQQDSAPAHRANDIVAMLKRETPAFISPTL